MTGELMIVTVKRTLLLGGALMALAGGASVAAAQEIAPYDAARGVYTHAAMVRGIQPAVMKIVVYGDAKKEDGTTAYGPVSSGSGVVIDAAKGEILTNNHVVNGGKGFKVELIDGRILDAQLVGRDPQTDIALIRIAPAALTAIVMGDSAVIQTGDLAFAVGYPFGFDQTLTMGVISGLGRSGLGDGFEDFIQTDASVNSGNSGGALLDSRGRLIGINTAIYSKSGDNAGIAFAVPVNMAMAVVAQIRKYGEVRRGSVGITIGALSAEQAGQGSGYGALVDAVDPGSPADKAGLRKGDVIVEANGRQIARPGNLIAVLGIMEPGQSVNLGVRRAGATQRLGLTVGQPRKVQVAGGTGPTGAGASALGATYRDVAPGDKYPSQAQGAYVTAVDPTSAGGRGGLQAGDLIVGVNGEVVKSAAELTAALQRVSGNPVLFIARGNSLLQLKIGQ